MAKFNIDTVINDFSSLNKGANRRLDEYRPGVANARNVVIDSTSVAKLDAKDVIKNLATDPRYAIYRGMDLIRHASEIEEDSNYFFKPSNLVAPDQSMSRLFTVQDKLTKLMSNLMSDKRPITPTIAKDKNPYDKIDSIAREYTSEVMVNEARARALSATGSSASVKSNWSDYVLQEYMYRTKISSEDYTETLTLMDFEDEDYATKNLVYPSRHAYTSSFKGYKTIQGLSLGSYFYWDITLDNYFPTIYIDNKLKTVGTYAPMVPRTTNSNTASDSLGNFVPAIEFEFEDYEPTTEAIRLFGDSRMELFTGFNKSLKLTMSILDDENFTWNRFFDRYNRNIYHYTENCVAPYKQSVLQCNLAVYSPMRKIHYLRKLLVIPNNYGKTIKGESDSNPIEINVDFSVVGELTYQRNAL